MMQSFGLKAFAIALAGAFAVSSAAPEDASAQGRSSAASRRAAEAKKPAQAAQGPQLDRERGGREAPAAVQAAGLACTITDAAFIGSSTTTVNGAQVVRNAYEVACQDGLGYFIFAPQTAGAAPTDVLDCLIVQAGAEVAKSQGKPEGPVCRLAGNAQPYAGLRTWVAQAGQTCTITNGRYVGELTDDRGSRYEVACSNGPGFYLDKLKAGGKPGVVSCLNALGSNAPCRFTTKEQSLAALAPIVAQSGRQCVVANARVAGRNPTTQGEVVEIGCQGAPGFFMELTNTGGFARATDCGVIANTPCQFTDDAAARAAMAARYAQRLKTAGFDCNVANLVRTGTETTSGREIVEVACSNRPDGALALLAVNPGQKTEILDCLQASRVPTGCTLTQPSVLYPRLTTAIGTRAPRGCPVSNSRFMGTTPEGETWIEVTCQDGRAFVVDYRGGGRVQNVLTCRNAAKILGGCRAGERGSVPKE